MIFVALLALVLMLTSLWGGGGMNRESLGSNFVQGAASAAVITAVGLTGGRRRRARSRPSLRAFLVSGGATVAVLALGVGAYLALSGGV